MTKQLVFDRQDLAQKFLAKLTARKICHNENTAKLLTVICNFDLPFWWNRGVQEPDLLPDVPHHNGIRVLSKEHGETHDAQKNLRHWLDEGRHDYLRANHQRMDEQDALEAMRDLTNSLKGFRDQHQHH